MKRCAVCYDQVHRCTYCVDKSNTASYPYAAQVYPGQPALPKPDPINPAHYQSPSGFQCIDITEHMNFCLGNATKYIFRAGKKGEALEDLEKARWYIDREIARLEGKKK